MHREEEAMASVYKAAYVSLHVRRSNRAAIGLYRDALGFTVEKIEAKYCKWMIGRILVPTKLKRWFFQIMTGKMPTPCVWI